MSPNTFPRNQCPSISLIKGLRLLHLRSEHPGILRIVNAGNRARNMEFARARLVATRLFSSLPVTAATNICFVDSRNFEHIRICAASEHNRMIGKIILKAESFLPGGLNDLDPSDLRTAAARPK